MSYSSKLISLREMKQLLSSLADFLSSEEISVSEYLSLSDLFSEIDRLRARMEDLSLVLNVDDSIGGDYDYHLTVESRNRSSCRHDPQHLCWDPLPASLSGEFVDTSVSRSHSLKEEL